LLGNTGQLYLFYQKDYVTALKYLKQCLEIRYEYDDKTGMSETHIYMGYAFHLLNDKQNAIINFLSAYNIAKNNGIKQSLSKLEELAEILFGSKDLFFWDLLAQRYQKLRKKRWKII